MKLFDLIFPRRCLLCRAFSRETFCADCCPKLPLLGPPQCVVCAVPFGAPGESHRCGRCLQESPSFDGVVAWGRYEGPVALLVGRLKYRGEEKIGFYLGRILAERVTGRYDCVLPVPLGRRRLRKRGFNQAAWIGREVARRIGAPFDPFLLEKRAETVRQTGLTRAERLRNLKGVFGIKRRGEIGGERLLLVDDVMTTGATAEACAAALKKAGAERVEVAVVARTP